MPRSMIFALPVLGCLILGLTPGAAHAQYLYVGFDDVQNFTTPGFATISAAQTSAGGNYSAIGAVFSTKNSPATSSTVNWVQLAAYNSSQITVSGGSFLTLIANGDSVVNLLGSNFTESADFHFSKDGTPYYTISGILAGDTSPFVANYYAPSTGLLEFDGAKAVPGAPPVPEASTLVSLGLLLLGLGGVVVKRHKSRNIAATSLQVSTRG